MKEEEKNHRTTPQPQGLYEGKPDTKEICRLVAKDINDPQISIKEVEQIVFKFFERAADALINDGVVSFTGFGSIHVDHIAAHEHYNPLSGEKFNVPKRYKFDFNAFQWLRQRFKDARGEEVINDHPPTN